MSILHSLKNIMGGLLVLSAASCAPSAYADYFDLCPEHFAQGLSPTFDGKEMPGDLITLCFDGFAVLYSGESKTPLFAAEHLTADKISKQGNFKSNVNFHSEPRVIVEMSARVDDFVKSGYTFGPLFPSSNALTEQSYFQSFSLANSVPRSSSLGKGPWQKGVERDLTRYVSRLNKNNDFYVITGPIFGEEPQTIGDSEVWVPEKLFKFVYDATEGEAWGYILENKARSKMKGIYSYEEMVLETGFTFLPEFKVEENSSLFD